MKMENGIDIQNQVRKSFESKGQIYQKLIEATERPDGTVTFVWTVRGAGGSVSDRRRFGAGIDDPAGRSVGRFSGKVTMTLKVDRKLRTWRIGGTIAIDPDTFSWKPDGRDRKEDAPIAIGGLVPNVNSGKWRLNRDGVPMTLEYNRDYEFWSQGYW